MESKATVRGVQAVLRRLCFLAPGIHSVAGPGLDPEVLAAAAAREDLTVVSEGADAEVLWQPGKPCAIASPARAVAVVASSLAASSGHVASERPAQTYIPLRDWVVGWFAPDSAAGRLLAPLLVSPAVGDRPTRVVLPDNREWIVTRDPVPRGAATGESAWRMAAVSGCGCGFFPLMPATLACLVMIPIALAVYLLAGWTVFFALAAVTVVVSTVLSVVLEKWAARQLLAEDPREFVLDEFAGMALTWMFLPPGAPWWAIVVGFFLFRVFDIFKWGVHWVEALPVPGRIVWDDLLAGLYAGLVLWGLCRVL